MPVVAFVADVHVGNHRRFGGPVEIGLNRRCRHTVESFSLALQAAKDRGAEALVVLGDLFDTSRPEPQVVAAIARAIKAHGLWVILLAGNHDIRTDARDDHALAPLFPLATIVDSPQLVQACPGVDLFLVPFSPRPAPQAIQDGIEQLLGTLAPGGHPPSAVRRVLCIHAGVIDDETPPWLRQSPDAVSVDDLTSYAEMGGMSHVFAGNWHDPALFVEDGKPTVLQVGALVPTGWDNPGWGYGTVALLDTKTGEIDTVFVPGPRFLTVRTEQDLLEVQVCAREAGCRLYLRVVCSPGELHLGRALLEKALGCDNPLTLGEVVVEEGERREQLHAASKAARSAFDLVGSLSAYVQGLPLEDGISRPNLLCRCLRLLGVGP